VVGGWWVVGGWPVAVRWLVGRLVGRQKES